MKLHLSERNDIPIYKQIVDQVTMLAASGRLKPEEELPSIRALSEQLTINPNTVARAYRELENAGIVTKKRATGSFISVSARSVSKQKRLSLLEFPADELLRQAAQLDVSLNELVKFIETRALARENSSHE